MRLYRNDTSLPSGSVKISIMTEIQVVYPTGLKSYKCADFLLANWFGQGYRMMDESLNGAESDLWGGEGVACTELSKLPWKALPHDEVPEDLQLEALEAFAKSQAFWSTRGGRQIVLPPLRWKFADVADDLMP